MGIFNWRGRTSEKNFRKRFRECLEREAPQLRFIESAENDLDLAVENAIGCKSATISLHRAYEDYKADPQAFDELFERWKGSLQHLWTPAPALEPSNLVPMVKEKSWLKSNYPPGHTDDCWHEELNEDLVVLYANHAGGFGYPSRSEWEAAGVDPAQVRNLALKNLRARTPERRVTRFNQVLSVSVGGNFEASLITDPSVWEAEVFNSSQDLLVAVPERDMLFASTDISVSVVWELASIAAHHSRAGRYGICSQLFVREDGRFRSLNDAVVDDGHPIPALDLLDVVAESDKRHRFAIIIATPLAPDARSAFRLFRKVDGYLNHIKATCQPGLKAEIVVNIHPESNAGYFALLASQGEYVASRGAELIVERLK